MKFDQDLYKKKEGILLVSVLFVILLTFIGLSLLTSSISHIRIQRARIKKNTAVSGMVQELVCYLHNLREKIFTANLNIYPIPETDYFNREIFPDHKKGPIIISGLFSHRISDYNRFKKIRISDAIQVTSESNNYCVQSDILIDILSGKIPLDFFPLFLSKKIEGPEELFLQNQGIDIGGTTNFIISDTAIEFHVSDFLIDSLKISGAILNWENLRKKFGLEIKDEPIEKGIYFIHEDNVLESIFIQDDLQRLIFSTENGRQIIQFYIAGDLYELSYPPGQDGFFYWDNQIQNDAFFKEKIIINGNVWSLEQKNNFAFQEDSHITLLVSGKTIIRTSLKAEHLDVKKMSIPKLTLICSNNSLFNSTDPSEVIVDTPPHTDIHASFLVNGAFSNRGSDLDIYGNVFAKDIKNQGIIKIIPKNCNSLLSDYFFTSDFKCVYQFLINFIEEVHDVRE
jgi:hypothetical protein